MEGICTGKISDSYDSSDSMSGFASDGDLVSEIGYISDDSEDVVFVSDGEAYNCRKRRTRSRNLSRSSVPEDFDSDTTYEIPTHPSWRKRRKQKRSQSKRNSSKVSWTDSGVSLSKTDSQPRTIEKPQEQLRTRKPTDEHVSFAEKQDKVRCEPRKQRHGSNHNIYAQKSASSPHDPRQNKSKGEPKHVDAFQGYPCEHYGHLHERQVESGSHISYKKEQSPRDVLIAVVATQNSRRSRSVTVSLDSQNENSNLHKQRCASVPLPAKYLKQRMLIPNCDKKENEPLTTIDRREAEYVKLVRGVSGSTAKTGNKVNISVEDDHRRYRHPEIVRNPPFTFSDSKKGKSGKAKHSVEKESKDKVQNRKIKAAVIEFHSKKVTNDHKDRYSFEDGVPCSPQEKQILEQLADETVAFEDNATIDRSKGACYRSPRDNSVDFDKENAGNSRLKIKDVIGGLRKLKSAFSGKKTPSPTNSINNEIMQQPYSRPGSVTHGSEASDTRGSSQLLNHMKDTDNKRSNFLTRIFGRSSPRSNEPSTLDDSDLRIETNFQNSGLDRRRSGSTRSLPESLKQLWTRVRSRSRSVDSFKSPCQKSDIRSNAMRVQRSNSASSLNTMAQPNYPGRLRSRSAFSIVSPSYIMDESYYFRRSESLRALNVGGHFDVAKGLLRSESIGSAESKMRRSGAGSNLAFCNLPAVHSILTRSNSAMMNRSHMERCYTKCNSKHQYFQYDFAPHGHAICCQQNHTRYDYSHQQDFQCFAHVPYRELNVSNRYQVVSPNVNLFAPRLEQSQHGHEVSNRPQSSHTRTRSSRRTEDGMIMSPLKVQISQERQAERRVLKLESKRSGSFV